MRQPRSTGSARHLLLLVAAIAGASAIGFAVREQGLRDVLGGRGAPVGAAAHAAPGAAHGGVAAGAGAPGTRVERVGHAAPAGAAQGGAGGVTLAAAAPATGPAPGAAAPALDEDPRTPEERAAARRLQDEMRRLVRDLEYNADAGLREPPQQTVRAQPAPWRPEPGAAPGEPPVISELRPSGAPAAGGVLVRIRGTNLFPAQVMFGQAPARVVAASGDEVTVVAPAAPPGAVTVVVTNDDGSYALAREPFTFRQ